MSVVRIAWLRDTVHSIEISWLNSGECIRRSFAPPPPTPRYEFTTLHCICLGGTHNVRSLCRLRAPALASVELSAAVLWGSPPADAVFLAVEVLALTRPPPDGGAPLVITVPADLLSDAQLEALRASVDAHDRTGRVTFQR